MEKLSNSELDILIEALDSWLKRDEHGALLVDMITVTGARTPEAKETALQKAEAAADKREQKRKVEKERTTLIQAKLIMMKDSNAVDSLL